MGIILKTKLMALIIAGSLLLTSCYYDNEEDLYGQLVPCDTSIVTYSVQVVSILSQNCYKCHGGNAIDGSGIKLQDFQVLKKYAVNGTLLAVLKHQPGSKQMPKNAAKLSNCNIAVIETWINRGALQN